MSGITHPPTSIPKAICELVRIASIGGGRGISLTAQPRGSLGANGKPFEIFAKNMFAGCLGALASHVDDAWKRAFSWLGSSNAPPDFMIWGGDAVEVKQQKGIAQIALNSSPPKQKLKSDDPRIEEGCRACEQWEEKDFIYCIGKTNEEYVEALWLVDGGVIADSADTYDFIFDKLSITIASLGGQPTNELGRFNEVDTLKTSSLRVRGMWSMDHPAQTFEDVLIPVADGRFVLNVLMSGPKWDAYPPNETEAVADLSGLGVVINRVQIPNSTAPKSTREAVHVGWSVAVV